MTTPTESQAVHSRILEYAEGIGWTVESREEPEEYIADHALMRYKFSQ